MLFSVLFCCLSGSVSDVLSSSLSCSSSGSVSGPRGVSSSSLLFSSPGMGSGSCGAFVAVDRESTGLVMVLSHEVGSGGRM